MEARNSRTFSTFTVLKQKIDPICTYAIFQSSLVLRENGERDLSQLASGYAFLLWALVKIRRRSNNSYRGQSAWSMGPRGVLWCQRVFHRVEEKAFQNNDGNKNRRGSVVDTLVYIEGEVYNNPYFYQYGKLQNYYTRITI
jgi:hypothetical protein